MAKKRERKRKPNYAGGRKPVHSNFAPYDAYLESGLGLDKFAQLNAARYNTTEEALRIQLHRMRRKLDELA
jgi:hypothetical protein